ncbi:PKD domain-containing protein [Flavobacterium adhaerens]|uniref:PKD domain-containing protein n=1 Tax=Flavobacterium adhaerens TaxID=3149043 RepID=UPI0032B4C2B0
MRQYYLAFFIGFKTTSKKAFFWFFFLFFGTFFSLKAQNCVVNAGILNETICANDPMLLQGNIPSPIIGPALWKQISGPSVTITSPNSPTTTVTGYTGGNTYVFRYSATCGDGVSTYQDKTVVVMPITIANAGADIASCPNSSGSISVSGNAPQNSGETGHWEITGNNDAGIVINFPNSATTTLTLPTTSCGVTTLTWVIEGTEYAPGQKCTSSDSITVTNYGGVTPVSAGADITLGNCYTTTQNVDLNGSFGGCGLNGQNGTWTFVSGPSTPTIANPNSNDTNISNLQEGTYVFRWTVVGPCASGSDEVSITVPAATQDVTNLGGGTEYTYLCDNTVTQATLVGQSPSYANETVLWTQTGGGACTIQSPTSPTTLITGISDAGDPYTFRYTLTNSLTGCTSYKDYVIEYKASDRTISAGDNIFGECDQTDFSIPLTVTGSGVNKYRILSGPATSPLAPFPTSPKNVGNQLNISLTESGNYILQFVRSETGELPIGCDYGFDNLAIVVSANAIPSNAGSDVVLACGVTEAPLAGVGISGAGNHYWTQVSGPNTATIVDKLEQNTTATGLIAGTYEFQYITKGGGTRCPLSIDNVTVYVSDSTLSAVDAGDNAVICTNSELTLNGSIPAAGEFGIWTQDSGPDTITFSDSGDPKAVATGFTTNGVANVLRWTIGYTNPGPTGCSDPVSDTMTVNTVAGLATTIAQAGPDTCYPGATTTIVLAGNDAGIGEQGTWTVTPTTGVSFVDIHDSKTIVTIPSNGTYTFTWSIEPTIGTCQGSSDNVVVTVADDVTTAVAGPDQSLCGATVTMDATLPSGATGLWTKVSGLDNFTISDATDPKAVFTFQNTGPYVFRWTIKAGNCSTGSDDVKITIGIPPTTANAGPDQTICNNNTTTLAGNAYDTFFELGAWTLLAGAPNTPDLADATSPTTTVSNLVQGTYTFRWTVGSKGNFLCPVTFDDVVIEVAPLANAGSDQTYCDVTTVQLVGTQDSKGTWTQTGGNTAGVVITQTPSDSFVANVTVVPGNAYQFTYTTTSYNFASGASCPGSSDSVNIIVNSGASVPPNAGPDQTICIQDVGGTITLNGNTPPADVSVAQWEWVLQPSGSVASITNVNSPTSQVTNLTVPGLYILQWKFESDSCADLSDIVRITVFQAPSQANAGPDDTVACQQTYTTNAVAPTAGIGRWSFQSQPSGANATIDSPNNPKTTLSNVTVLGTYILNWTVTNGPFTSPSLCAPSVDQVSITFNDVPPSVANAGPDQNLCSVTQTNLAATAVTNGKGTWTQTSGAAANIASPNDPASLVFGLTTGVYEFTWTATTLNEDGCFSEDTVQIEIYAQPINVNAGPDQTLPEFSPVVMAATAPTVGQGEWVKVSGPPSTVVFVDPNSPTTNVSGLSVGTTVLEWRVTNGPCAVATDQVSITILAQTDLELTKLVTPTSAKVGDEVTFTINVYNNNAIGGTTDATGVAVRDVIPDGYTLVPGSVNNGGIYNAGTFSIVWANLSIPLGATTQLNFRAKVNATGNYVNTAQVIACNEFDIDSTPNNNIATEDDQSSVSVTIVPTSVDLSLTKTVVNDNLTPLVNTPIAFEVRIKNSSLDNATGVQVRDLLPSGYSYQLYNSTKGTYDPITGIWNVGAVEAGVEEVLTLTVNVNTTGDYLNIAEVTACDQPDIDSTPNNGVPTEDDYASVLTTPVPLEADLSLTKTVDQGNLNRLVGSQVIFKVVVSNAGSQTASGVTVTDLLPNGFTFVSSSVTSGAYDEISGIWTVGALAKDAAETLLVTATVNAAGDYKNNAEVTASSLPDPDSTPNNGENAEDDFATITIIPVPAVADLSLTKIIVGGNTSPLVGTSVSFQIVATNNGPENVTGVQVTDLLPSGYTYVISTPSAGTYDPNTGVWSIGAMVNGASETLTVNATVNSTGDYTNIAEISTSSLPDLDSTPNNGIDTEDDYASVIVTPIKQEADLSLTKTIVGGNTNRLVDSQVTFNVVINNSGPQTVSGVTVTDLLPNGFTFVSSSVTTGAYNNVSGLWTVGSLANGASETLIVTATVNGTGNYTNIAEITTSSLSDPDSTPNNAVTTEDDYGSITVVPVTAVADLSLTKTIFGGNSSPAVGAPISFQIITTNDGPQDATGVQVTDLLPTGYTYVGSIASVGTYNPTTGIWNIGTLNNGGAGTLTVNATVNATGEYTNIAEVSASSIADLDSTPNNGIDTEDDYASVIVTPIKQEADLSLTKTIVGGNTNRLIGDAITFNVVVNNLGPQATSGVTVTDLLPSGFTYTSSNVTAGSYDNVSGLWTIGSIANGGSATLIVNATVNATGDYTNIAEVTTSSLTDPDSTPGNGITTEDDYGTVTVVPVTAVADLSLTKTIVGGNASPLVGAAISFQVVATNAGPQNATGVRVRDLLPSGYTYVVSTATSGTYNPTTGVWNIGSLNNGVSETLTVNATVKATGNYINVAEVTASSLPDLDSTPNNGIDTEDDYASVIVTPIKQEADLSLTKTIVGGNTNRLIGSEVTFNVVVNNAGPQAASGVTVNDLLPNGFTFVSSSITTGSYNETTGIWAIGTLANGASETLIVTATVTATGNHTNEAEISASSIADPDSTPNNGVVTEDDYGAITVVPVTAVADLSLTKTIVGGNASPLVGTPISFQIITTNDGPQNVTGVQVKDLLPSGYTYVGSIPSAGTYNAATGIWNINALANGASATLTVNATVNTTGDYNNIAEITASSLPDLDSAVNNGITTEDDYASVIVTPVKQEADLSLTKTIVGGNTNRLIGSQVTFNVVVNNVGSQDTSGVTITDLLPDGFTFVSSNVTAGAYNSTTGLWTIGNLANGASETLIVNATVNASGDYTNIAEVTTSTVADPDSTPGNGDTTEDDYASITIVPVTAVADLSLNKSIIGGNNRPLVGAPISFQIAVTNSGPQGATGVQITDLLPTGYTYVGSAPSLGTYNPTTGVWNIGALANGASVTLTVNATVNATGVYTNIAEITASDLADLDSTPNNGVITEDDYAAVIVLPIKQEADLALTKTIDGGNTNRLIGSQVAFSVVVTNSGPQNASLVSVTDLLPSGFTFVSSSITTGTYNSTTGVWNIGTLVNGASETLTVTATVNATGNHTNKVEVTASGIADPDSTPNNGNTTEDDYSAITVVPVTSVADLSLTKTIIGGNASPLVGTPISFQIIATNDGPQNATGVQVKDFLPSGYTYVISTVTAGTYNPATGIWNINNLEMGVSETLVVNATVNATGTYTNIAEVSASNLPDLDSTPNNGVETEDDYASVIVTPVQLDADLSLSKTIVGGNANRLIGSQVTFNIAVNNAGSQPTSGVTIRDLLPGGFTFVSSSVTTGAYNQTTGIWNIGALTNGATETLIVTATVNASGDYVNEAEVMTSAIADPDSMPGNGVTTEDDYARIEVIPVTAIADLSLTKAIIGGNASPLVGASISFQVIATNNGPQNATGVQVTDLLPTGYTYVGSAPSTGTYNATTGVWNIGALASGVSTTLTVNATVNATGVYTNIAEVTASSLPDLDSTPNNGDTTEDDYASVIVTPVKQEADLSLSKTIADGNINRLVGSEVTFNVVINNAGPRTATGVAVTDLLPNGFTFVSANATTGTYNSTTGLWSVGALVTGASETLIVKGTVNASGNHTNKAEVTASSISDPDSTPNNGVVTEDDYASVTIIPVTAVADLSLTKTIVSGNPNPLVGSSISFQVVATNSGPQTATAIQVKDLLPSGYTYVISTTTSGTYNPVTGVWNIASLPNGISETLTVNATVNATGVYTNIAEVIASSLPDLDSTPDNGIETEDDYASVIVTPIKQEADLSLTKIIVGGDLNRLVGSQVTFNVVVNNAGGQDATGVAVTDLLPSGFTYVSSNVTAGSYNATTGVWNVGALANGVSETLIVNATVNSTGNHTNKAEVTSSSLADPDSTPNNGIETEDDYASVTIVPITSVADLSLTKTIVGGNASPLVGSSISFQIVVSNAGPQNATGVQVKDLLPTGYTYVISTPSSGTYNPTTGVWNISNLSNNSAETLTINATVNATGIYTNIAEVIASSLPDTDSTPNNGVVTEDDYASVIVTPIKQEADLSLTKTIVGGNVNRLIGSQVTFNVVVNNAGPQTAQAVAVTDLLPNGFTFESSSVTTGSYDATTGLWTIGTLINGASETLTVNVTVNATGNYNNIAEITASSISDPDSTPNNGVVTEDDYGNLTIVPVTAVADLSLTKAIVGGNASPLVGSTISFRIVATNDGPQTASGVEIKDLLPSGFTYVNSTATAGTYNETTGIWAIASLVNGVSETLTVNATVNATGDYINVAEISASSLPDLDSTPNNGIATEDDYASVVVTPVTLEADLSLTKTIVGGNTNRLIGSQITFNVVVNNAGSQPTSGVLVRDLLPSGFTFVSSSVTTGVYNETTGVWNIGNLANGASETLIVNATVNATGIYTNNAEVTASAIADPDSTPNNGITTEDDYATITIVPVTAVADLSVTKTIVGGNASPLVGSSISFEVVVSNSGPQNATNVEVKDLLPSGYTYVISTTTAGTYVPTTGIWTINILANGISETLTINAVVNDTGIYNNIAEVTASSLPDLDSTPNNGITTEDDYASVIVTPIKQEADLALTKTILGGNPNRLIGSQVTFNVVVNNAGPQTANGVTVTDLLPNGFSFISSNVTAGSYNEITGVWSINALANGASETLIINAIVNANGNHTNSAEVTASSIADSDSTPNNGITTEDDYASVTVIPVTSVADLSLTKTIVNGNATPLVGDAISFQVVATNDGPQTATGIQVKDLLPSGYTYVISTTTSGTYNPTTGVWNITSLASGVSETLTVNATVNATGIYTNIAEITASSLPDLDSTPNNGITTEDDYASVVVTPIKQQADLSLTKIIVGGNPNRLVGSQVTFNIVVNNAGAQDATGVQVTDLLPSGFTYVSSNVTAGSYNTTSGVWNIGTLANGASETLIVNATVNASGNHTNVAEVTASNLSDPDSAPNNGVVTEDDYASIMVVPVTSVADLALTKTIVGGNASPLVGTPISFQIIVTNSGPQTTTGIQITDLLPSGFTYVISTATRGIYNPVTGIWDISSLASGTAETLTVNATVNSTGDYINVAEITASSLPDLDSTPNNGVITEDDYASVVVTPTIPQANLSLTKTAVRNNTNPLVGGSISFEIVITNNGPQDATGVQVKDLLPSGFSYVISTTSLGMYNVATGIWNIGNLPNGISETLTVNATVNATGDYTNIAEIIASSLPDPNSTPNNGDISEDDYAEVIVTPVVPTADLSLTKTVNNAMPLVGSVVLFELTATNNGPENVTGVQVRDMLPSGYTYVGASASAGVYTLGTGVWNIGALLDGQSETLVITATVNDTGAYLNTAEVISSSLADSDSTPDNGVITEDDYASVAVNPVATAADLSLTKTIVGGNTSPAYGATVTFQVTVTNNGPQATTNVRVRDILPNGYTFSVYSSTAGVYDEVTGIWNIGAMPNSAVENLLVSAIVQRTGDYQNIAEIIDSSLQDPDSTPNNGIVTEDDYASITLTPVNEIADLSISKLVVNNNITPLVGEQISFQITVTNSGPSIATGVEVKDILPSGYQYVFYNASSGSYDSITGIWRPGLISPNSTQTLLINALVKTPTGTTDEYLNVAEITASNQFDPDSTPNNGLVTEDDYDSVFVTPVIVTADLSVEKTIINNQNPNVGDIITFQIKVNNAGPGNATGVEVKDLLPSGFEYVSHNATSGNYTFVDGKWLLGAIINGGEQTLLVYARVKPVAGTINEFLNIAEITASNLPDPDSTPNNGVTTEDDYDSINVAVQYADLSLDKSVSNPNANVNEVVTFTIQINNLGSSIATGVSIEDLLPIGYSKITNVTNGGIYRNYRIVWTNLTIPLDGLTVTYQATVESPIGLTDLDYVNVAQITASNQFDPNSTPNNDDGDQSEDDEDSAFVEVPKTDIAIIKSVDSQDPSIGKQINFTVTADNVGSLNATNVEVEDVLPAGYQFISTTSTSGVYDAANGVWRIPAIEFNSAQTLTITVKVLDNKDYLNIAKLVALDQIDTNASNNESSATIEPTCLKIYNEFSPNNDGVNEVFYIDCIANYPKNKLDIFNRWGDLVYTQNAYKNTWDGTSNGSNKVLPVGTYFYVLDLGDGSPKTSGWLYLKR